MLVECHQHKCEGSRKETKLEKDGSCDASQLEDRPSVILPVVV